jgi:Tfp pilus assembly protein PilW
MVCKNTFTNARRRAAFTLIEVIIAAGLGLMIATAILTLTWFSSRNFVAMSNYTDMSQLSRLALDKMSKDIRQMRQLTSFTTNSLVMRDSSGNSTGFVYDPNARTLVKTNAGVTTTYLTECDALQFWVYQHTPKSVLRCFQWNSREVVSADDT